MSCHLLAQLIETILQPSSTIHAVYITAVQDQLSHQMNVSSFLGVISLFIEGKSSWTAVYKASRDSPPPSSDCIAVVRQLDGLWPAAADSL